MLVFYVLFRDSTDCRLLCKLEQCHQRGVIALSFNPEGNRLVSVGLDNNFSHILWTDVGGGWTKVQKFCEMKSENKSVSSHLKQVMIF